MNIANKISTFRILSVPFFIACLLFYSQERAYLRFWAIGIFLLAVVSDAIDGYIARKAGQQSKAGLLLDPLGDKLLLMSAFIFLSQMSAFPVKFPLWVTFIVISRDFLILLGVLVIYIVKQTLDIHPSRWGKLTTTFQMIAVFCILFQYPCSWIFWWIAVFFTVVSGMDYVRKGFKVLYAADNHRAPH